MVSEKPRGADEPQARDYWIRHEILKEQQFQSSDVKAVMDVSDWLPHVGPAPIPAEWTFPHYGAHDWIVVEESGQLNPSTCFSEDTLKSQLRHRFRALADQWLEETQLVSSLTDMVLHPAYQQVIGLGIPALPFILKELQERPAHWFWALFAITGENPVPAERAGDLEQMTAAWLDYGRRRGYL